MCGGIFALCFSGVSADALFSGSWEGSFVLHTELRGIVLQVAAHLFWWSGDSGRAVWYSIGFHLAFQGCFVLQYESIVNSPVCSA